MRPLSSLFSSSGPVTLEAQEEQRQQTIKGLEAAIDSGVQVTGANRIDDYDEVAGSALEDVREGEVAWVAMPGTYGYAYTSKRIKDGRFQIFVRGSHSVLEKAFSEFTIPAMKDDGTGSGYGIAVASEGDWAYLAATGSPLP